MKRCFDIVLSLLGLLILSPVMCFFMLLVWLQDLRSPFYIAPRVGLNGVIFPMVKLRSMAWGADQCGVDSTAADDHRITWVGHIIRRYKLDEILQLWNVLKGDMSLVGPRPQVQREVDTYSKDERQLLDVRPGITDLSSIVFSDEGDILSGSKDPDLKYRQVIRPWKSRLGLLYISKRTNWVDLYIIVLTVTAIVSRPIALRGLQRILQEWGAGEELIRVALRDAPLHAHSPPGMDRVVQAAEPPPR